MFWAVVIKQCWLVDVLGGLQGWPGVEGLVGEEGRERGGRVGLLTFLAGFRCYSSHFPSDLFN